MMKVLGADLSASQTQSRDTARRTPTPQALKEVAQQFEALFIQMMLKSMREASLGEGLMDSHQSLFYRDIFDEKMALALAKKGAFGIAEMLVKQVQGTADGAGPQVGARRAVPLKPPAGPDKEEVFATPTAFVHTLLPAAREAAGRLGVAPEVLIAQAALETGWGKAIPRREDGRSSHNLFGIKADKGWSGAKVTAATIEIEDGVVVKRQAAFRAYDSFEESFADYARLLQGLPRYRKALEAGDAGDFLVALRQAGYATDPAYASKIQAILEGPTLRRALKVSGVSPINVSKGA